MENYSKKQKIEQCELIFTCVIQAHLLNTELDIKLLAAVIVKNLNLNISAVAQVFGMSRPTVYAGIKRLEENSLYKSNTPIINENTEHSVDTVISAEPTRIRKQGGGRKSSGDKYDKYIINILEGDSVDTYGDPMRDNKYIANVSLNQLHDKLNEILLQKYKEEHGDSDLSSFKKVSKRVIRDRLKKLNYSLKQNKKLEQVGQSHPDRNKQFEQINLIRQEIEVAKHSKKDFFDEDLNLTDDAKERLSKLNQHVEGLMRIAYHLDPVISIDSKKKENIGNFAQPGQKLSKTIRKVKDHDFNQGDKVCFLCAYNDALNLGHVNLVLNNDTPEANVASIEVFYNQMKDKYPYTKTLYILADCGGSNSYRSVLFKYFLSSFTDKYGIDVKVIHYPLGTSKYNLIEHRLFPHMSRQFKASPLTSIQKACDLLEATTTKYGLKVLVHIDSMQYQKGFKLTMEQKEDIQVEYFSLTDAEDDKVSRRWTYLIRSFKEKV